MRIALLTTDAAVSAKAVRLFIDSHRHEIVLVADSSPFRSPSGPPTKRTLRALWRSRLLLAPYLVVNFVLPRLTGRSLRTFCRTRGIGFLSLGDVNASVTIAALHESGAEALLLYHFDQILSAGTIAQFPDRIVNVHPSLLPAQRGPVPTIHLLLEPLPRAGVTVHRVTPTIDDGAILAQSEIALPEGASAVGAARHLHLAAIPVMATALDMLKTGATGTPQAMRLPYCGFPTAAMVRRVRGLRRHTVRYHDVWTMIKDALDS
jgi:methionyl-tRNA formyltransferase